MVKELKDAFLLMVDNEDYIDQFTMADGVLVYQRVHSEGGRTLRKYIRKHFGEKAN